MRDILLRSFAGYIKVLGFSGGTMKRKIAAALAFNAYAFVFVWAFWAATPFLFHGQELASLKDRGLPFKFEDWGFDDHYLWRLLAAAISTAIAGFICGALAREKGSKVALIANIPSVVGWIAYAWMFFFLFDSLGVKGDDKIEGLKTAYGIVSIIAIPMTCWLAMKFGEIGERFQFELSQQDTTLGVSDWHWAWMWLPLSPYGYKIVINIMSFIGMQLRMWSDRSLLGSVLSLLGIAIVVTWIAPLVVSYQTLARGRFQDRPPAQRGALVAAILVGGYFLATAVGYAFGWVLGKFGF